MLRREELPRRWFTGARFANWQWKLRAMKRVAGGRALAGGAWGARCHAVNTSVLLEAGEAFAADMEESLGETLDPIKLAAD
ncbi:MAG: hypothetical protein WDN04_17545 [Rhodospirillales bacterium]